MGKKANNASHSHRSSVPNLANAAQTLSTERSRAATQLSTASQMLSDPSQQQPHRRSVSSMFGNMFGKRDSGSVNIANSMTTPTQLTDDEDNESSYSRSQSARSYSKPYGYANTDIYSVTFQSKPFGLTLN